MPNISGVASNTSGVTIGGGVDLAQNYGSTLASWGMPAAAIAIGTQNHYFATAPGQLGVRGQAAYNAVAVHPISVTPAVANTITANAVAVYGGMAAAGYGTTTGTNAAAFDNLSVPIQNALTEAVFNAGAWPSALAANPGLAAAVQSQNWSQVSTILQANVHQAVKNAASALATAIANKSVPASGKTCN